jgi:FkbM family methyltransferase
VRLGPIQRLRSNAIGLARRIVGGPGSDWTMDRALARIAKRVQIRTVIDVGASDGNWFRRVRRHLPGARGLLIEAQAGPHEPGLIALRAIDPMVDYVLAAAGDHEGEVHFDASDPFGGAAAREPFSSGDIVIPMTSIDVEVERRSLAGPFLIKLDTHGFEPAILDGAAITLKETVVVIVEAYNFELRPGVQRFHEMCSLLEGSGFRCADLADPMRRPKDGLLWQMDLVFIRADRPEFRDARYG